MEFLEEFNFISRPLNININGISPSGLFLGRGKNGLEIAVFKSINSPNNNILQRAYKERKDGRATPILIVVLHSQGSSLCGTYGEQPPISHLEDSDQVERLCASALSKPDKNAAIRFLNDAIPTLTTHLPGIHNEGLLSIQELQFGTKDREDWENAIAKSNNILRNKSESLINSLGFQSTKLDNLTDLLTKDQEKSAIAILINESEMPDIATRRFNNISPIDYALIKADEQNLPWVLMIQGDRLRLYNSKNIGVGKKGRKETFIECQLSLISNKDSGLIWLLFSADALKKDGTIYQILENSKRFAADIASELRERIYNSVVPKLAMGITKAKNLKDPSQEDVRMIYEMALKVLFRLLFIAYAEDRDLLPYKANESYRKNSLKVKAIEVEEYFSREQKVKGGEDIWLAVTKLGDAISDGKREWGVPQYEGTIFSKDRKISLSGEELTKISVENEFMAPALRELLLSESEQFGKVPIDFRSLSVREFGTIYEGLLESELSIAEENLTINKQGTFIPAKTDDHIEIKKGEIYLHDSSGARKSSGSFYTPDFAVEYLLDESLEPAITKHLNYIATLSDGEKTENIFNFKVADISMGSGHFLVAAIDRIENKLSNWLHNNSVPGINRELQYMKEAALKELGDLSDGVNIDDSQLLRRMIARKCIFGVDINPITVELARLSIWIHTFVPGLPLSLLDHNLIQGNSLVGIESLSQIRKKLNSGEGTLLSLDADKILSDAAEPLKRLARLSDASIKDIQEGRSLIELAKQKTDEIQSLCDLITAQPLASKSALKGFLFENWDREKDEINTSQALNHAREILKGTNVIHFPISFPEVFLSASKGFNVIIGNPPWEKIMVKENEFYGRYMPGLRGLSQRNYIKERDKLKKERPDLVLKFEKEKLENELSRNLIATSSEIVASGGHPDLYIPFCFRFLNLLSEKNGLAGVVLPRSSLYAKGSAQFRRTLFKSIKYINLCLLENTKQWVFDIDPRYTICLTSFSKSSNNKEGLKIQGPFNSLSSFKEKNSDVANVFEMDEVFNWNDTVSIPLFPKTESAKVFAQLRKAPRLDSNNKNQWRVRAIQEMNMTFDSDKLDYSENCPKDFWKVYKGASFDLWNPDTGEYNAFANPKKVLPWLQEKRLRANLSSRDSIHKEFPEEFIKDIGTLSANSARLVFRDITNRTNTRTVIACLIPPKTFITNTGPVIIFSRGDQKDEAYLLGVLSSIPLDWYARRFVETHLNFFILNPLPIPRPNRDNIYWQKIVEISGRLACPDERFRDWAEKVDVDYGPIIEEEKKEKIYEIDALVSHLYGLKEDEITHIYETFHSTWDYKNHLKKVLQYYKSYK